MGNAFAILVQKLVDEEIQRRRMTLPPLQALHGKRSYEATCGKCLAFGWAEGDPEQAWSKLVEIGWSLYRYNARAPGYAVCPSCGSKAASGQTRAGKAPRRKPQKRISSGA
jgi:hypothetical protein